MNQNFLSALNKFASVKTRLSGVHDLALLCEAENILCFYFDSEVGAYLPAPGFPQTLSYSRQWQDFLTNVEGEYYRAGISFITNKEKDVICLSGGNCFLLLVGVKSKNRHAEDLQEILPVICSLIHAEITNLELKSRMKIAEQSAKKSEQLTISLDKMRSKLQQALKTEEEFLSVASHELKTPITSLNAFVHLLLQLYPENENKQTNHILTRIKFQIDRIIGLIADLLDTSKLQDGNLELNLEETHLDAIVDEIVEDNLPVYSSLEIIRSGNTKHKILCDRNRIGQVINNLLSNAVKYSMNSGKIIISLLEDQENVQFDIQDFGIGIKAESLPKIFDRFFRAHTSDYGRLSSLGLGLYISLNIIKRHNGKIWVDSEHGHGSTFHFTLPKQNVAGHLE